MPRIVFIGLGAMGAPMACNLTRAGFEVAAYDRAAAAREKAAALGLAPASSLEDAARCADAAVTMLQNGDQVLNVWRALLPQLPKGAVIVDCSTIDMESARQAHDLARRAGMLAVDAPVSGGVAGAQAGTLTFMCGGAEDAYEAAQPILAKMGARLFHCGGPGLGQAAKLCNNLMLGVTMIATAEAFALAARLGLAAQSLFDVASASSGQSWSLTRYCPAPGLVPGAPSGAGYAPGFMTRLMLKDLRLAETAAAEARAVTPLCAAAAQLYALYDAQGGGEKDFSGIFEMLDGKA
ncbi:3-hydroxyisobutyrate dehydrogenase [Methylocystis parvus]|uniref:3-hydroxyisobutyrate dehydrogenase n=1 Tax=Methylocystis parvus TaxID=134 RepID=A0A6B8M748_9HYPH|nr:3-hydroxyisobutyrate dehydrogenase [Methylocystis parvus]QGM97832.1 3-hydroxyisobutyrate dehydrogenase [Methylocystis parvus]WBK01859.1 3-hydroxyisobutyrate dehydrogenase [Methylocystis parvus OBBP]